MAATPDQADENRRAARRMQEIWSSGDVDALGDVMAEDVAARFPGQEPVEGRDAYAETIRAFRSAFAEFTVEDHDVVAEGDSVCRQFTVRGTHEGAFMGVEPTGNAIELSGMNIARFDDGKITEEITYADMHEAFRQLGVVEGPGE